MIDEINILLTIVKIIYSFKKSIIKPGYDNLSKLGS